MAANERLDQLSTTDASNTPAGSDVIGSSLSYELRSIKANIARSAREESTATASAAATLAVTVLNKIVPVSGSAGGSTTITLPAAATAGAGFRFTAWKTDNTNNVVIDANGAETINGSANYTLSSQYEAAEFVTDGTSWIVKDTGFIKTSGGSMTGDLTFGDNDKAIFGAGSDLQIYHDGSNSYVKDAGIGYLILGGQSTGTAIHNGSGQNLLITGASDINLAYAGNNKLATTSGGINVTGTVTDDGATHDGDVTFTGASYNAVWDKSDNALEFADNAKAVFGAGSDLQIYHDGSNSFISDSGTGDLFIQASNNHYLRFISGGYAVVTTENAGVELRYNNGTKIATTSAGVDVTGTVTSDGADLDGAVTINEAGASVDFRVESDNNANMLFVDGGNDRVGIGTNAPGSALHVSVSSPRISLTDTDTGADHYINADSSVGNLSFDIDINSETTSPAAVWNLKGTERMRLTTAGSLGIGTNAPLGDLHVKSGAASAATPSSEAHELVLEAGGNGGLTIATPNATGISSIFFANADSSAAGRIRYYNQHDLMNFSVDTSEVLRFETNTTVFNEGSADRDFRVESNNDTHMLFVDGSADSVGIGTSAPDSALHVYKQINDRSARFQRLSTQYIDIGQTSGINEIKSTGKNLEIGTTDALDFIIDTNNAERLRIDSSGNVGIGTSSPVNKLSVNGSITLNNYYETYLANAYYDSAWKYAANGVAWGIGNNFGGVTNGTTIAVASSNSGGPGAALTWSPAFDIESSGNVTINERGADVDFRVESNNDTHALFVDGQTGIVRMSSQPAFNGQCSSNTGSSGGTTLVTVKANNVNVNRGNHYNTTTGLFTCPADGVYQVSFYTISTTSTSDGSFLVTRSLCYKNGVAVWGSPYAFTDGYRNHSGEWHVECSANDTLEVRTVDSLGGYNGLNITFKG